MNLDRQLARLLAVVIVMIAATFGVSVAQAHEGHAHHHAPAAVETTPVQPAPVALAPAAMPAPQLAALTETPLPPPRCLLWLQPPRPTHRMWAAAMVCAVARA